MTTIELPAIRGIQAERIFYTSSIPISLLENEWFLKSEPAVERAQRPAVPSHISAINEYIRSNLDDYVLGSLTFAIDFEADFHKLSDLGELQLGVIKLSSSHTLHSLDGQHRFRALVDAIKVEKNLRFQSIGILIYVEPSLSKKKQMFSDMNSTPKKVPKGLNISFDNRDPFGRVAKKLVLQHPILKDRTEMFASRVNSHSNNIYSLSSVQDTLKKLHVGSVGRVKNISSFADESIMDKGLMFFNALYIARLEFEMALNSQVKLKRLRTSTILFNSTTLRVIAGAYFLMEKDWGGEDNEFIGTFVERLKKIDFNVNSRIFVKSGFVDRNSSTPNARNQQVYAGTYALFNALLKA